METLKLKIENMGGAHCVQTVQNTIAQLPGVEIKNITVGKAEISYDPAHISPEEIIDSIQVAGYKASLH